MDNDKKTDESRATELLAEIVLSKTKELLAILPRIDASKAMELLARIDEPKAKELLARIDEPKAKELLELLPGIDVTMASELVALMIRPLERQQRPQKVDEKPPEEDSSLKAFSPPEPSEGEKNDEPPKWRKPQ